MAESAFKRALLFVNPHKSAAKEAAGEIQRELTRKGFAVTSYPFDAPGAFDRGKRFDIAFSLGGDGTVLFASRLIAPLRIPLIPINFGAMGFIAEVPPSEWAGVFERWLQGSAVISRRLMLELTVERQGKILFQASCLNDAVISASGIAKLIVLNVELERGETTIHLGHYRSDGLIVATPTGSTAYSVAAGGPILDPEIEAVIINPICPFTLSNRPVVMPLLDTVLVEVEAEQRSGVLLTLDGQVTEALEPADRIRLYRAPYEALLVASDRQAFYRALHMKLNWPGKKLSGEDIHA
ncbi:MAG: NAD(+)/NADH kinase [Treponema sp.]|jgi:NAD+ kinase|nr:NAD(+)/NADH kinase [Treponema sp.]